MVAVLLLTERDWSFQRVLGRHGRFCVAAAEGAPNIIAAQVEAAHQLQPALENLQKEVARIRAVGSDMGKTLDQIDEEMRLAAKLQRDFLPRKFPQVGPLQFSVMFRPAAWVSGDIYSVERLDEIHVGVYVADAVGHGLPAALLTMFIKQALPTKRIGDDGYHIVPPDQAMLGAEPGHLRPGPFELPVLLGALLRDQQPHAGNDVRARRPPRRAAAARRWKDDRAGWRRGACWAYSPRRTTSFGACSSPRVIA